MGSESTAIYEVFPDNHSCISEALRPKKLKKRVYTGIICTFSAVEKTLLLISVLIAIAYSTNKYWCPSPIYFSYPIPLVTILDTQVNLSYGGP